jgi:hypothetical protein
MSSLPFFAYGSDMSSQEMLQACPGARCLGRARLAGFRLAFSTWALHRYGGKADIVVHDSSHTLLSKHSTEEDGGLVPISPVWGVLWSITERERHALHLSHEYYPDKPLHESVYVPLELHVLHHSEPVNHLVEAFAYTVVRKFAHIPPTERYLHSIITAAQEQGLPSDYIESLSRIACYQLI